MITLHFKSSAVVLFSYNVKAWLILIKPFLSCLQFVLRREVENTCDQCYESSDYGVLEQQHDHSCVLGLVLSYFSLIMQRDG